MFHFPITAEGIAELKDYARRSTEALERIATALETAKNPDPGSPSG